MEKKLRYALGLSFLLTCVGCISEPVIFADGLPHQDLIMMRRIASSRGVSSTGKWSGAWGTQLMSISDRNSSASLFLDSRRQYSVTRKNDSILIIGGLGVVVAAATAQYGIGMYENYVAKRAAEQPAAAKTETTDENKEKPPQANADTTETPKVDSPFSFTSTWFAKNFYDGGFEDKMTKREAALILGIRESATVDRIKEAYRKLLPLNHPDRGGSAYIATKINEAKDLLLKGK